MRIRTGPLSFEPTPRVVDLGGHPDRRPLEEHTEPAWIHNRIASLKNTARSSSGTLEKDLGLQPSIRRRVDHERVRPEDTHAVVHLEPALCGDVVA